VPNQVTQEIKSGGIICIYFWGVMGEFLNLISPAARGPPKKDTKTNGGKQHSRAWRYR